jgi:hypothetical protein
MMAGKLALRWGILDVEAWLSSLPQGALDFWMAFDQVNPIGDEWFQTALIAQNASLQTYAQAGVDVPEVDDFMPARYKRRKKRPVVPTQAQQMKGLETLLRVTKLDKVANVK